MTFLTKFPRTKLFTVMVSVLATVLVWSALAWPDWTSATADKAYVAPDPQVQALQALAALPPEQLDALVAATTPPPPAPAPRQVIHQTVVIRRTVAGPASIASSDATVPGANEYVVASTANGDPASLAPPPSASAPSSPSAPPAKQPAAPPAANVPSAPAAPAPSAPSAPAAPPPPAAAPAKPAPAPAPPAKTKAS
jgi:hypothetical protein